MARESRYDILFDSDVSLRHEQWDVPTASTNGSLSGR